MGTIRYLNVMLTIIAVLLCLQLWTQWTMTPSLATPALARDEPTPFPNAARQRKEINDSLVTLNKQIKELNGLFKDGKAKVKVDNFTDMPKQGR